MDIDVEVNLNVVYFSRPDGSLGRLPMNLKGRVSKKKAEEYLIGCGVQYETVFQVKKEEYVVTVRTEDLKILE